MIIKQKTSFIVVFISLILLVVSSVFGASGDVDPTFNPTMSKFPADRATVSVIQPDGKIIISGNFETVNGIATNTVVRLNTDGTLDTSFNAPSFVPVINGGGLGVQSIALQSTGKILVSGFFNVVGGEVAYALVRLNVDGSRDTSFAFNSATTSFRSVYQVEVLPDDSFIALHFNSPLFKFFADGSADTSYNATSCGAAYLRMAVLPSGKAIIETGSEIRRCNADGSLDTSFQTSNVNAVIFDIAVQNDGKFYVGGAFSTINGFVKQRIVRLNEDGTVDTGFNHTFMAGGYVSKIFPLSDGKVYVAGLQLVNSSSGNRGIHKLNNNGSVDSSFTVPNGTGEIWDLDQQTDGKIIIASIQGRWDSASRIVDRLNTNGSRDSSFQGEFGVSANVTAVYVQPDGKILAAGDFNLVNNVTSGGFVRFNADGTSETEFLGGAFPGPVLSLEVQTDGKIIVGYNSPTTGIVRLNSNGSVNTSFPGVSVYEVRVQPDGKIILAGANFVRRFNMNASSDSTFNTIANSIVRKVLVQPDGKLIIAGDFTEVNSVPRGRIARLNPDGSVDSTFNTSTGANGNILDIELQDDGKIIIGGNFSGFNFANRPYIARLNSDGTLDTGYTPNVNNPVNVLAIQTDNKVFAAGTFTQVNGVAHERLAKLNQNGTTDTTFKRDLGIDDDILTMYLQSDENLIIGGKFNLVGGVSHVGIARLFNSNSPNIPSATDYDFDGDGSADLGVFRPSNNVWYQLLGPNYNFSQTAFGIANDVVAPADFDGDGKTDLAIFRPSNGNWWYLSSVTNTHVNVQFGQNGDIPRPSDFDGDGKADFVVFRPSTNVWHRFGSTVGVSNVNFGLTGDKPLVGDFDGDGKSDVAIYRPSTGDWWWQSSIDNSQRATHWGISTDIPSPGDYDGDGITDFAVYRSADGVWYIYNSSTQQATIIQFGIAEDKPVPADYDGDGKVDMAVYRPSTGVWYLLRSTAGFQAIQFGISTDIPIPNALIP